MGKAFALILSPLVLIATPAAAELPKAPLEQVFATYNDCFAATEGGTVAAARLEALGWARATTTGTDGPGKPSELLIYGHRDRAPLIMLSALDGEGLCVVMAQIETYDVFEQFKAAFGKNLPKPDRKGQVTFSAEGRIVQIAPTGSRAEPALRLAVFASVSK